MTREKPTTTFRNMLNGPRAILLPGVYDALTAKIAEKVGFKVITHTGYGTSASLLGQPDVGFVSFKEMCDRVAEIAHAVAIPVFSDADTGYGNPLNVYRTVKEYIRAGAAGLFIEDQKWPKKCGHMMGKKIITIDELVGKAKAALDARNSEDPDFVIGIRTDAIAVEGFAEALKRAKICSDLGIDFIYIEAYQNQEQMKQAIKEVGKPLLLDLIEGGKTPLMSFADAEEIGFKIVAFPLTAQLAATKAVWEVFQLLKDTGSAQSYSDKIMDFDSFNQFIDLQKIYDMEMKYT